MPNKALLNLQVPRLFVLGTYSVVETPSQSETEKRDGGGGKERKADRMDYEEFKGKPLWKSRSYRELLEIIEILTMIGIFDGD